MLASQQKADGLKLFVKIAKRKINMEELQKELVEKIKTADVDKLRKIADLFPEPYSIIVLTLIERIEKNENK